MEESETKSILAISLFDFPSAINPRILCSKGSNCLNAMFIAYSISVMRGDASGRNDSSDLSVANSNPKGLQSDCKQHMRFNRRKPERLTMEEIDFKCAVLCVSRRVGLLNPKATHAECILESLCADTIPKISLAPKSPSNFIGCLETTPDTFWVVTCARTLLICKPKKGTPDKLALLVSNGSTLLTVMPMIPSRKSLITSREFRFLIAPKMLLRSAKSASLWQLGIMPRL